MKLLIKIILMLHLIAQGNAYCQTTKKYISITITTIPPTYDSILLDVIDVPNIPVNKLRKYVRDTTRIHCMPWEESYKIHEMAARKIYLDSLVNQKDQTIIRLETSLSITSKDYEDLLLNAGQSNAELIKQNIALQQVVINLEVEKKSVKKRLLWSKVQTGGLLVLGVVAVILVSGN